MTEIGNGTFRRCTGLTELYSLNPTPPTVAGIDNFTDTQYENVKVYVPQGSLSAYKESDGWWLFKNIMEFDASTGVEGIYVDSKDRNNVYYDIQGRKLDSPKKGLNIINGKKVLMK